MFNTIYVDFKRTGLPQEVVLYMNNLLLYHMIKINFSSFLAKAGARTKAKTIIDREWKPLAEKTIAYKRKHKYLYAGKVAINIRTRRLHQSLKPGWFRNGVYIPRPDQIVEVTPYSISFAILVPYAKDVHTVRPIIVNVEALLEAAAEQMAKPFETYLVNYYARQNSRKKTKVKVTKT